MKMFMKRLLIGLFGQAAFTLAVLFTGSLPAQAESDNPFGFETNKDPLQYEYCKKVPKLLRNYGYRCGSAPRPHPDFEWYNLQFVKGVGLCRILAGGQDFALEMEFDEVVQIFKSQIAHKYGPPTKDTKQETERLDEEDFDPHGVREQYKVAPSPERHVHWSPEAGFQGLGDVKAIELEVSELAEGLRNHISATFWLVTFDECIEAIDNKARQAF